MKRRKQCICVFKRADQTIELYSSLDLTKDIYRIFNVLWILKSLQFLLMMPNIEEDLLIVCWMWWLKVRSDQTRSQTKFEMNGMLLSYFINISFSPAAFLVLSSSNTILKYLRWPKDRSVDMMMCLLMSCWSLHRCEH